MNGRIGFVGLGIMGGPMAANLVKAGFDVTGYNRSAPAVERLTAAGGEAAEDIAGAVRGADVVITMLPDSPDVEAVALGVGGVLEHATPGTLYLDMSTVRPGTATTVARAAAERKIRFLDAPVSGGQQGAISGSLSVMCGGAEDDFEAALPFLRPLGTTIVRVGPVGAGQTVKAANQLVVAGTIELVAEALVLLEASGVDAEAGLRVLAGGLAGNQVLERKRQAMIAREFTPGFRVDLHHKDLNIVLAVAEDAGVVIPLGAAVAQLMAAVRAQGYGALDHTALLKVVEKLSGRNDD